MYRSRRRRTGPLVCPAFGRRPSPWWQNTVRPRVSLSLILADSDPDDFLSSLAFSHDALRDCIDHCWGFSSRCLVYSYTHAQLFTIESRPRTGLRCQSFDFSVERRKRERESRLNSWQYDRWMVTGKRRRRRSVYLACCPAETDNAQFQTGDLWRGWRRRGRGSGRSVWCGQDFHFCDLFFWKWRKKRFLSLQRLTVLAKRGEITGKDHETISRSLENKGGFGWRSFV